MAIRTTEYYDSFSDRLLEIRFTLSEKPEFIRTFRSSYASLCELLLNYRPQPMQLELNLETNKKEE